MSASPYWIRCGLFTSKTPVDEVIHDKIMKMFRNVPEQRRKCPPQWMKSHLTTGNIDDVMDEHRAIIEQYKLDFTQYEERKPQADYHAYL